MKQLKPRKIIPVIIMSLPPSFMLLYDAFYVGVNIDIDLTLIGIFVYFIGLYLLLGELEEDNNQTTQT